MTREIEAWRELARELQLEVEAPYTFVFEGRAHACIALVKNFGSERGTLVRAAFPVDAQFMHDADEAGFAYSHLEVDGALAHVVEILSAWGYCGVGPQPVWLKEMPVEVEPKSD